MAASSSTVVPQSQSVPTHSEMKTINVFMALSGEQVFLPPLATTTTMCVNIKHLGCLQSFVD